MSSCLFNHLGSAVRYLIGTDAEEIKRTSALFLLKMKEHRRISEVAVDDIVAHSEDLFHLSTERTQAAVRAKIAEAGFDPDTISGLDEVFTEVMNHLQA